MVFSGEPIAGVAPKGERGKEVPIRDFPQYLKIGPGGIPKKEALNVRVKSVKNSSSSPCCDNERKKRDVLSKYVHYKGSGQRV